MFLSNLFKFKEIFKKNLLLFILVITIFSLDRLSKIEALKNLKDNNLFLNDFLNFTLIWNTGIGFGLFSAESNFFYNSITFIIGSVIIILSYMGIKANKYDKIIFSSIIGGAIGNFYDRIVFKAVPDFIDLHYENFHWFTFNVADIFITVGIIFYLIKGYLLDENT